MQKIMMGIRGILSTIVLFFLLLVVLLVAGGYQLYERALLASPIETVVRGIQTQPAFTPLTQIPAIYIDAVLAVEDPYFYQHNGICLRAIGKAFLQDLKEGKLVAGGSTITQQFCKNQFFTQKKQFTRKIAEVFMVWEVEKKYTKDEILTLYINSIYYGEGYYNVSDASYGYFGKPPAELNAWEATLLAGIPNAPSVYAPTINVKLALQRQRQVIQSMVAYRYITQNEADAILKQKPNAYDVD